MSYTEAITYLHTRLATVTALKKVLNGIPTTAHNLPLAFTEAADGTRLRGAQVTGNEYFIDISVLVEFQDNVLAEDQIAPFINSVPDAIETRRDRAALNGVQVVEWVADYYVIGDKTTRRVRFRTKVTEKGPTGSGI